jgi:hypothetical protein
MGRPVRIELAAGAHRGGGCPLGPARRRARADELRCDCGSLLARLTAEGVELKCRRCKRRVVIPITASPSRAPPGD